MIVVPVLMINCQVLEKLNIGPVAAQTNTISSAPKKVVADPTQVEIRLATFLNDRFINLQYRP